MGSPWPAPQADEQIDSGRQPNYLLRRAIVMVVVVAIVGGAIAWFVGRDGGDDDASTGAGVDWDTVVLQAADGEVTLVEPNGDEIESFPADQMGLLDVGLEGRLVVGIADDPSTTGLGVMSLDDGEVTELTVEADGITRLDTSSFLLAANGPSDPLELVDTELPTVTDLRTFADASDPIVDSTLVRIDPGHTHVAFTELSELETVLVDLETATASQGGVSLAGSLVDIADGVVLTTTNRGQTSLVDLYRLRRRADRHRRDRRRSRRHAARRRIRVDRHPRRWHGARRLRRRVGRRVGIGRRAPVDRTRHRLDRCRLDRHRHERSTTGHRGDCAGRPHAAGDRR